MSGMPEEVSIETTAYPRVPFLWMLGPSIGDFLGALGLRKARQPRLHDTQPLISL